jgi:glycolate oxidase FAD binding subunit
LRQLQRLSGQPLPLRASAWWHDTLVLQLAGAEAAVRTAVQTLGGESIDAPTAERFWSGLRDQRDEYFAAAREAVDTGATLWRMSVAPAAAPLAVDGEQLIEWGGGQRWVVNQADAATMRAVAGAAGGHAIAYRGTKGGGAFTPLTEPLARIHRELKRRFDPDGLFNPGRLYPDL